MDDVILKRYAHSLHQTALPRSRRISDSLSLNVHKQPRSLAPPLSNALRQLGEKTNSPIRAWKCVKTENFVQIVMDKINKMSR